MSVVRFGLGGATDPGDPIQGPGDVSGQVWLGHLAEQFGVRQFYADAWTAPAQFKTNDSLDNGGYLCGVPGETCASGDARPGYATYLAGQAKGFAEAGIPLQAVDFVNGTTPAFDGGQAFTNAVEVSAFRNGDGSRVAEILNTGPTDQPVSLRGLGAGHATAYVTNETDSVTLVTGPLTVPARSLLTVVTN